MPPPTAPPRTDNAVRSMPTAERAMMSPTKISSARTALLTALRSDSSAPVAEGGRYPQRDQQHGSSRQCPFNHGAHRQRGASHLPVDLVQLFEHQGQEPCDPQHHD